MLFCGAGDSSPQPTSTPQPPKTTQKQKHSSPKAATDDQRRLALPQDDTSVETALLAVARCATIRIIPSSRNMDGNGTESPKYLKCMNFQTRLFLHHLGSLEAAIGAPLNKVSVTSLFNGKTPAGERPCKSRSIETTILTLFDQTCCSAASVETVTMSVVEGTSALAEGLVRSNSLTIASCSYEPLSTL